MRTRTINYGKYKCKGPETGTSVLYFRDKGGPKIRSRGEVKAIGSKRSFQWPIFMHMGEN